MAEVKLILPDYALPREVVRKSVFRGLTHELEGLEIEEISVDYQWQVSLTGKEADVAANYVRTLHPSVRPLSDAKARMVTTGYLVTPGSVGFGIFADLGFQQAPAKSFQDIPSESNEHPAEKPSDAGDSDERTESKGAATTADKLNAAAAATKATAARTKPQTKAIRSHDFLLQLRDLRKQLAPHAKDKASLKQLVAWFGLNSHIPYSFVINKLQPKEGVFQARFTSQQREIFDTWAKEPGEVLLVGGTTRSRLKRAFLRTRHLRDVTDIQRLGFLEWAVFLKEGTRAAGLIPRVGNWLGKAKLTKVIPSLIPKAQQ